MMVSLSLSTLQATPQCFVDVSAYFRKGQLTHCFFVVFLACLLSNHLQTVNRVPLMYLFILHKQIGKCTMTLCVLCLYSNALFICDTMLV